MHHEELPDVLAKKIRMAFRFLDVTKDGLISEDDYREIADSISAQTGASPEQAEKTRYEWNKWFAFMQPDPSVKIDENRFLATVAELFRDMPNFRRLNEDWAGDLFNRMDLDGDGKILLEELKVFYRAVGITNEETISKIFIQLAGKEDEMICRERFVTDLVNHFTSSDPNDQSFFITDVN